jgi:hypothetical protein
MTLQQWAQEQKKRATDEESKRGLQVILDAIELQEFPNLYLPSPGHSPDEAAKVKKANRGLLQVYAYGIGAKDAGDQLGR